MRERVERSRALLVEHEQGVADRVANPLRRAGWEITIAANAARARTLLFTGDGFELVLVDAGLPESAGRELCREIRAAGGPPVIMIGRSGSEAELVDGLQLGADDYVAEPLRPAELVARAAAVLRRATPEPSGPSGRRRVGRLELDPATRRVTVEGRPIGLTPREYALLLALVERQGRVVTREELFAAVWGPGWLGTTKALDVQISGLRRKLGETVDNPRLLHTVRGVGFLLTAASPTVPQPA
jgi:two-component system KDP operon response regulator KdpE